MPPGLASVLRVAVQAVGIEKTNAQLARMQGNLVRTTASANTAAGSTGNLGRSAAGASAGIARSGTAAASAATAKGRLAASSNTAAAAQTRQATAAHTAAAANASAGASAGAAAGRLRGMTAALGLGAVAMAGMGLGFEREMTKIVSLTSASRNQVDAWKGDLKGLAIEAGRGPKELAGAMFTASSAGFEGAAALDVVRQAALSASAGLGETRDITEALTGAINAYGPEVLGASEAMDVLIATTQAGNFETSELAGSLGRVTPFAEAAKVSFQDVGGAIALLTRSNNDARMSVFQVTALMRAFSAPTKQAQNALDELGLSTDQVRNMLDKRGLVGTLQFLDKRLGGNRDKLRELIPDTQGLSAAMSILNADAKTIGDTFGVTNEAAGMAADAHENARDAVFRLRQAWSALQVAGVALAGVLTDVINFFEDNEAALTALLLVVVPATTAFIAWRSAVLAASVATQIATGSFWGLSAAIRANPIVAAISVLVLLGTALFIAAQRSEGFQKALGDAWSRITGLAGPAIEFLRGAIEGLVGWLSSLSGAFSGAAEDTRGIQAAFVWLGGAIIDASKWIVGAIADVVGAVRTAVAFLEPVWRFLGEAMLDVVVRTWEGIKQQFHGAFQVIGGIVKLIDALLRGDFGDMWRAVKQIFRGALDFVLGLLRTATAPFRGVMTTIGRAIERPIASAWEAIKTGARDALEFIEGMPGRFRSAGESIGRALGNGLIGLVESGLNAPLKGAARFINKVFDVISKAPFIDLRDKKINVGNVGISLPRLARGGVVNAPMAIVGEQAPQHPEYVIPTNPAYRRRAQGLLADAAQSIGLPGLQAGGKLGGPPAGPRGPAGFLSTAYGPPWNAMNGTGVTATGVDLRPAKKALGVAVDPNVIPLGSRLAITPNPHNTRDLFSAFDTGGAIKGNRIDFYDWRGRQAQMAWGQRMVRVAQMASGLANPVGVSKALDFFNPMDLIKKLPTPGDFLPDWFQGMGTFVIKQAKDWILDKAGSLFSAGKGIVTNTGTNALAQQLAKRFGLSITSGYRSPEHNARVGGVPGSSHTKGSPANPGAHDFVPPSQAALAYAMQRLGAKWADIHDFGSGLHLHVSWFRKGGLLAKLGQGIADVSQPGIERLADFGIPGLQRGGQVPSKQITRLLKQADTPKKFRKSLRKLSSPRLNTPALDEVQQANLSGVLTRADELEEWASRASAMTRSFQVGDLLSNSRLRQQFVAQWGEGHVERILREFDPDSQVPLFGLFGRRNETQWLQEALVELFAARNRIIQLQQQTRERLAAFQARMAEMIRQRQETLDRRVKEAAALVAEARKRLQNTHQQIRQLDRRRKHLSGVRNRNPAQQRELQRVRSQLGFFGQRRSTLRDSVLPALVDRRKALTDHRRDVMESLHSHRDSTVDAFGQTSGSLTDLLERVQGIGSPTTVLRRIPDVGVLGGRVFNAQMQLMRLGEETKPPVSPDRTAGARDVMGIADLRAFSEAVRLGAFRRQAPFDNLPTFHAGGVVSGVPAGTREVLAKVLPREGVIDARTMQRGITFPPPPSAAAGPQPIVIYAIVEDEAVDRDKIKFIAEDAVEVRLVERDRADRAAAEAGVLAR